MTTEQLQEAPRLRPYRRHYGVWRDGPGQAVRPRYTVRWHCLACSREALGTGRCPFCGGSVVVCLEQA